MSGSLPDDSLHILQSLAHGRNVDIEFEVRKSIARDALDCINDLTATVEEQAAAIRELQCDAARDANAREIANIEMEELRKRLSAVLLSLASARIVLRDLWRLDPKEDCPESLASRVKDVIGGG